MTDGANVVVIGAGIVGLSTAYHLARDHRVKRVVVVDRSYLCSGASGRNGGGVRAQWSSETNIRLMQESLRAFQSFARDHKINTWFRRGGYVFIARTSRTRATLEASVELQNRCGLGTRLLRPAEIREVVPDVDTAQIELASYNADDAVVFPWPFVWGYAEGARAAGVEVRPFTNVLGIDTVGRTIRAVETDRGRIETSVIVNAAGAHSPDVARLAGVSLPNKPHRHEICSSEPLKPWLTPLVACLDDGLYFSQSTRGEIVGGIANDRVPDGPDQSSSWRFLALYARGLVRTCPRLSGVKVLRQWAGLYDVTPDASPIAGPIDEIDGFVQASGFMGHGFMMAPVVGRLLAEYIATGRTLALLHKWRLGRFRDGQLLDEGMIIG